MKAGAYQVQDVKVLSHEVQDIKGGMHLIPSHMDSWETNTDCQEKMGSVQSSSDEWTSGNRSSSQRSALDDSHNLAHGRIDSLIFSYGAAGYWRLKVEIYVDPFDIPTKTKIRFTPHHWDEELIQWYGWIQMGMLGLWWLKFCTRIQQGFGKTVTVHYEEASTQLGTGERFFFLGGLRRVWDPGGTHLTDIRGHGHWQGLPIAEDIWASIHHLQQQFIMDLSC
ncbi:hypothetical protein ACLOJK_019224 [Asimina triloba]